MRRSPPICRARTGRPGQGARAGDRLVSAARGSRGPRYRLRGSDRDYLRMNSNSYLSLSHHPKVLEAADAATHLFGAGPGAVRFIDGTFAPHVELESRIAQFVSRPAARAFNSAYTTMLGVAIALAGPDTYWIGDALNHNCIIRAMRIANVPSAQRAIFRPQRRRRPRTPPLAGARGHRPGAGDLRRHLLDARRSRAAAGDRRGGRAARGALPRRHRHDHGRLPRHRRLRPDRPGHRGALRREGRHLHRDVRQGIRRERRVRGGERDADRSGPPESGHLHLHQPARGGGLRGSDCRGGRGGQCRRTRAIGAPEGTHRSVPRRAR